MGKILILCEKPDAAKDLSSCLDDKMQSRDGCLEGEKYIVTWAVGHLFVIEIPERVKPEFALWKKLGSPEDYKQKELINAPFLPDVDTTRYPGEDKSKVEQRKFVKLKKKTYDNIVSLLKRKDIDEIVLAADADAEGERIHGDVVRHNLNVLGNKNVKVTRFWNPGSYKAKEAVQKALKERKDYLEPKFLNLYLSAIARGKSDYLVGMKFTKIFSETFNKLLSVGRVQSTVIGILGRRYFERKNFVPKAYWNFKGFSNGVSLQHFYYSNEVDENGVSKKVKNTHYYLEDEATKVQNEIESVNRVGQVIEFTKKVKSSSKPTLYNTGDFETDFMGITNCTLEEADLVLEYLRDEGYTTYPRTDGNYYSKADMQDVQVALETAKQYFKNDMYFKNVQSLTTSNKIFDDKAASKQNHTPLSLKDKVPTDATFKVWEKVKYKDKWLKNVKVGYDLIATRFALQFLEDDEYEHQSLLASVNGHLFEASGDKILKNGWRDFAKCVKTNNCFANDYKKGEQITLDKLVKDSSTTTKPPVYTAKSIVNAMINVSKALEEELNSIDDDELKKAKAKEFNNIKKILIDVKGIGTQASRKTVFINLEGRGYIKTNNKKEVELTDVGLFLYENLPSYVLSLETTAKWEQDLELVRQGSLDYRDFIDNVDKHMMDNLIPAFFQSLPNIKSTDCFDRKPSQKQIDFAIAIETSLKSKNITYDKLLGTLLKSQKQLSAWIDKYKQHHFSNNYQANNSGNTNKVVEYKFSEKQLNIVNKYATPDIIKLATQKTLSKDDWLKIKKWLDNHFKK